MPCKTAQAYQEFLFPFLGTWRRPGQLFSAEHWPGFAFGKFGKTVEESLTDQY